MVDAVLRSSIGRNLRRSEKMSEVIGKAKVLVKNYTKVSDRRGWSECRVKVKRNRWVWDFL